MVQAKQLAYHDRDQWLSDPRFGPVPMDLLVSKDYAAERRKLMDPARALPWDKIPSYGSLAGDTVYVAAVDREGNAASLVHSVYGSFGASVVAGRTGVVLQNRSAYFSLDPKSPNRLEPGKVPLHTLIASLAYRNDKLWAAVGCMGADGHRRGARHAAHRGPHAGRHHRRAEAPRPPRQPVARLARICRPRARHHDRSGERAFGWRLRPEERRGGDRVLGRPFALSRTSGGVAETAQTGFRSFR
jgi:hypothetical protein